MPITMSAANSTSCTVKRPREIAFARSALRLARTVRANSLGACALWTTSRAQAAVPAAAAEVAKMPAGDHPLLKEAAASIVKRARAIGNQLKETEASLGREEDVEAVGAEPAPTCFRARHNAHCC